MSSCLVTQVHSVASLRFDIVHTVGLAVAVGPRTRLESLINFYSWLLAIKIVFTLRFYMVPFLYCSVHLPI